MSENSIIPYNQLKEMATDIAKSKLFGCKTPEEAVALMLLAQAEGTHPMRTIQDFSIINGRPAKKTEAMSRDANSLGMSTKWLQLSDTIAEAEFSHPVGGTVTIKWTIEMAIKAGLASKDVWKNYPRAMLRSRCISEGVRTVCPAATSGMYSPEEAEMINVTPDATVQVQSSTLATAEELKARAAQRAQQQKEEPVIIEQPVSEHEENNVNDPDDNRSITADEAKELIKAFSDAGQDIKQYLADLSIKTGRTIKDLKGITFGEYKDAKIKLERA